ncbi:hypothetical protein DFH28DRAFT_934282 [Melampsora americana]|nr:hypothetical protein DFH28DRAFT_934282 [Melampsora americana]
MNSTNQHKHLANHKARVLAKERHEARHTEDNSTLSPFLEVGPNNNNESDASDFGNLEEVLFEEEADREGLPDEVGYSEALMRHLTSLSDSEESENSDLEITPINLVDVDWEMMLQNCTERLGTSSDSHSTSTSSASSIPHHSDDEKSEPDNAQDPTGFDPDCYPFKKEEIFALLLLGSGQHLLSQRQFEHIRHLLRVVLKVIIPSYKTLGRLRSSMCTRLGLNVLDWESSLKNPCHGLSIKEIVSQELANPVVAEHLVFVPEYDPKTPTDRFSQSKKWREGFSRTQRVQMVSSTQAGHFYLYEPVRDSLNQWIVPIYFFQTSGNYYAKCVKASMISIGTNTPDIKFIVESDQPFESPLLITVQIDSLISNFIDTKDEGMLIQRRCGNVMYQLKELAYTEIPLPNPWRIKAKGKVIRNVPITLYSDDTSGNVSKKWNKHMSYYFTLSGLPPGMTNQIFNIHFLATSNKSSALELGDNIVDELNTLGMDGFTAHDISLDKYVLVMVVPLCHLGDSPMHAEITNTTNPSITLNPCRICTLSVDTLIAKQDAAYTRAFLGLDHGEDNQYSKEEVCQLFDNLNKEFGARLFNPFLRLNGFDGHLDTPVEILHVVLLGVVKYLFRDAMANLPDSALPSVMAQWKSFDTSGLNILPIQPKTMTQFYQSLVGKDFCTILQTVPFVLFPHFSPDRRRLWTALSHLGSYVFQPQITDMNSYLHNLKKLVNIFLGHLTRWTAQWTNKPKFHMLIHLVESIERFGPLLLCATKKFESFNGITRYASIHSPRHNPGLHIATTFLFARLLRMLLSGGSFWDSKKLCRAKAGKEVLTLFRNNPWLQKDFGFNSFWNSKSKIIMKGDVGDRLAQAPDILKDNFPKHKWSRKKEAYLESRQKVSMNTFVILDLPFSTRPRVGFIQSFWTGQSEGHLKLLSELKICALSTVVDNFYGFCGLHITEEVLWVPIQNIRCVINVQHNCQSAECELLSSPARHDGQLPVKAPYQIKHKELNSYIINSGALYSAEDHREVANLCYQEWTPQQWSETIELGLKNWETVRQKKAEEKKEKHEKENNRTQKQREKKRKHSVIDPRLTE